ncbi:MAG TPA: ankyrin repeat domain-containing protein, partial [Myxococcota bacterium]|nr:ankyrin repeat domain-containing protein [Myxococcota bacterium]
AVARALLEAGADAHACQPGGPSVLVFAVEGRSADVVEALVGRGVDVDLPGDIHPALRPYRNTPLMDAAQFGVTEIAQVLVDAGADVHVKRVDGKTAIDLARGGGFRLIERLLADTMAARGPKVGSGRDWPDWFGAARSGDLAVLRELLAAGVPVDAEDHRRRSALGIAAESGQHDAFVLLREAGAQLRGGDGVDLLKQAAASGNPQIVRAILDAGYPADGIDLAGGRMGGITPLMTAVELGNVEVVAELLKSGANPNARHLTTTVLDLARQTGEKEIEDLLKQAGARDRSRDPSRAVAARFAQSADNPNYQLLLKRLSFASEKPVEPWKPRKGVYRSTIKAPERVARVLGHSVEESRTFMQRKGALEEVVRRLQDEINSQGFLLVRAELTREGRPVSVRMFPTHDMAAVLFATGTSGEMQGVTVDDIVDNLREVHARQPILLTGCGEKFVEGTFRAAPEDPAAIGRKLHEVMTALRIGDGVTVEGLTAQVRDTGRFLLQWE